VIVVSLRAAGAAHREEELGVVLLDEAGERGARRRVGRFHGLDPTQPGADLAGRFWSDVQFSGTWVNR